MKMKTRNIMLIGGTVLGLLLLAYPLFSSSAQKTQRADKMQELAPALKAINRNAVANAFYNKMQQGEKSKSYDWGLSEAFYSQGSSPSKKDGRETVVMVLKKESSKVRVVITEHYSPAEAGFPLTLMISQAAIKDCKESFCGDGGRKIYGDQGFSGLQFKKDNYFVSINCDSEETAQRFADYAIKAIAEK